MTEPFLCLPLSFLFCCLFVYRQASINRTQKVDNAPLGSTIYFFTHMFYKFSSFVVVVGIFLIVVYLLFCSRSFSFATFFSYSFSSFVHHSLIVCPHIHSTFICSIRKFRLLKFFPGWTVFFAGSNFE